MWTDIAHHIATITQKDFTILHRRSVSGGCINQGYALVGENSTYFVKLNEAKALDMFMAEALGLREILATNTIRVPEPLCWGITGEKSYLVMEWLEFTRGGSNTAWEAMGRKLAALHKVEGESSFGWHQNNTIGSTVQVNTPTPLWGDFFAEHRIGFQLRLAQRRGGNFPAADKVVEVVKSYLHGHQPLPSLVHGDLWAGNAAVTVAEEPVILDPAVYRGDREVDLAMTELFGGFPSAFYRGYEQVWPLDLGYNRRKTLYNLYHVLNHFNLFGGGYEFQARTMLEEILATSL